MNLPKVKVKVRVPNPAFTNETKDFVEYYVNVEVEAEVLTVHFNTGKMRIRFNDLFGNIKTADVDSAAFFETFSVVKAGE